jgi:2-keto-4-pentenoate hydratase/2-oxohepta-3-ene-1,7-dioic acid hydratase in catechol pathway
MSAAEIERVWRERFGRAEPKLICVGLNYRDHAEEQGVELPAEPLLFGKFANALCDRARRSSSRQGAGTSTPRPSWRS